MKTTKLHTNHNIFSHVLVTHGLIDFAAEIAFGYGHCHALMQALYDLTGWRRVGAYLLDDPVEFGPIHVAVQRPDGLIVDIEGVWREGETWSKIEPTEVYWLPIKPTTDTWRDWDYKAIDKGLAAARSLTQPILDRLSDKAAVKTLT